MFSDDVMLTTEEDLGEVCVALYLLLCGDGIRFALDPSLQSLSIPLYDLLNMTMHPDNTPNVSCDGTLSVNFIQFTHDHLPYQKNLASFPFSEWYLKDLYKSARAVYAHSIQNKYDILIPVRKRLPEGYSYLPMLVSVKNREEFSERSAFECIQSMKKQIEELREDGRGIALLILIGMEVPAKPADQCSKYDNVLVSTTGIPDITYETQLILQKSQLEDNAPLQYIVVVPEDDSFGVSKSLKSCMASDGEAELFQSCFEIKNAAAQFLNAELEGKEDALWYNGVSKSDPTLTALFDLLEEGKTKSNKSKEN